jgi:multisubunit Na+/H+ antiporter MnhC subunit
MQSSTSSLKSKKQSHQALVFLAHRWPVLAGIGLAVITPKIVLPLSLALILAAIVYPVSGTIMRQWRTGRLLAFHLAVFLVFVAIAFFALQVDETTSRYVLAAGFVGHAVWDAFHFRANRIVPRWYAELCAVLDLALALAIAFLPFG